MYHPNQDSTCKSLLGFVNESIYLHLCGPEEISCPLPILQMMFAISSKMNTIFMGKMLLAFILNKLLASVGT